MIKRFSFLVPQLVRTAYWFMLAFLVAWEYRTLDIEVPNAFAKAIGLLAVAGMFCLPIWLVCVVGELLDLAQNKKRCREFWAELLTYCAAIECARDLMILASSLVLIPMLLGLESTPLGETASSAALWVFVLGVGWTLRALWLELKEIWRGYRLKKEGADV